MPSVMLFLLFDYVIVVRSGLNALHGVRTRLFYEQNF